MLTNCVNNLSIEILSKLQFTSVLPCPFVLSLCLHTVKPEIRCLPDLPSIRGFSFYTRVQLWCVVCPFLGMAEWKMDEKNELIFVCHGLAGLWSMQWTQKISAFLQYEPFVCWGLWEQSIEFQVRKTLGMELICPLEFLPTQNFP